MRETLCDFVTDSLARGRETALVQRRGLRTERWSYARLAQTAFQFARELEARQIQAGERVLFWSPNCAEWVAAFWGCLLRGAVVVPLDEQSAPDFVERVQQQVSAKLLLCGAAQARLFKLAVPRLNLDELETALRQHAAAVYPAVGTMPDALAEIIFTSGTTAEPKGVCLSHRNLLANIGPLEREIAKYRRWERPFHPVRFLNLLPLSHVFGQFMGLFVPSLLGGEVFLPETLNPAELITLIKRERISVVAAVPRQLETLRDKLERDFAAAGKLAAFQQRFVAAEGQHFFKRWWLFRDLHARFGWKFWAFVAGGATLATETENFWQRLGYAVVQGYGMTETASLVSVNHPFKLSKGSIGKTLPGQQIRLGENGEILVRGVNIAAGYWRDGVQALPTSTDGTDAGWLRTGDVGAFDEAGNLYFKGRQKDVIVTGAGLNIYPEDLEAALNRQAEVRTSCVIGLETPRGPAPVAVIILRDPQADPADIVARANTLLSTAQKMRHWEVWPEPDFPRTPTHKVRKNLVKQALTTFSAGGLAAPPAAQPLHELVAQLSGQSPTADGRLSLDSLGRVQLASALEDRFQIELDEAALTAATTLADLEKLVQAQGRSAALDVRGPAYPYPHWSLRGPFRALRLFWYYVLILPLTRLLCWVNVRAQARLNELREPALFIANHISMVDHGLILSALPWRFRHRLAIAMEGERLRGWRHADGPWLVRGWLRVQYALVVLLFNVFPLPQKSGFRRSFAYAGEAVDRGYSVLVFPEGRITKDGQLQPFMPGVGLLAAQLKLPVVPIKIAGLHELKQRGARFAKPGSVTITFGAPRRFAPEADPAAITAELFEWMRAED